MRIVAFEPRHLTEIDVQPAQKPYMRFDLAHVGSIVGQWGAAAFTGIDREGVVGSAGVFPLDVAETGRMRRAGVWAIFSERVKRYPLRLVKVVRMVLAEFSDIPLEAHVAIEHAEGARFVEMLGFEPRGIADIDGAIVRVFVRDAYGRTTTSSRSRSDAGGWLAR